MSTKNQVDEIGPSILC